MPRAPASSSELQRLWKAAQNELNVALREMVYAHARAKAEPDAWPLIGAASERLARRVYELNTLADLLGRRRLMLEVDAAKRLGIFQHALSPAFEEAFFEHPPIPFSDPAETVPRVSFKDAIREITKREPRLAETAAQVGEIYQQQGFAAVNAATESILKRIQTEIGVVLESGKPLTDAAEIVSRLTGWTRNYSHTVVRTNLTHAYTAGRFAQLRDPDVRQMIPALRFVSVREPWDPKTGRGTRPNHAAAHGLIAAADDEVWNELAPPLGFNCRCTVALVTRGMLENAGLLNKDGSVRKASVPTKNGVRAGPDPGFAHAGRPDLAVYG